MRYMSSHATAALICAVIYNLILPSPSRAKEEMKSWKIIGQVQHHDCSCHAHRNLSLLHQHCTSTHTHTTVTKYRCFAWQRPLKDTIPRLHLTSHSHCTTSAFVGATLTANRSGPGREFVLMLVHMNHYFPRSAAATAAARMTIHMRHCLCHWLHK